MPPRAQGFITPSRAARFPPSSHWLRRRVSAQNRALFARRRQAALGLPRIRQPSGFEASAWSSIRRQTRSAPDARGPVQVIDSRSRRFAQRRQKHGQQLAPTVSCSRPNLLTKASTRSARSRSASSCRARSAMNGAPNRRWSVARTGAGGIPCAPHASGIAAAARLSG